MKRSLTLLALAASFAPIALAGPPEQQHAEELAFPGQAIAIGWAAESCKGNELSKSEREACNALGLSGKAEDPIDSGEWLPVFLKCPDSKDDGVLISIDENLKGDGVRWIVDYRSGRIASIRLVTANTNSNFPNGVTINLDTETNSSVLKFMADVVKDVSPLNNKICDANSSSAKTRYDQIARANRIKLHKAAPNNFREGVLGRDLEACVDGPSLARSWGGFFGRAFACVHVSGLLMQPRLLAKMASAGGRSKQSSDLDRPLLRAVYLPLRIERSRPSSFLLQARQRRARMSFRTRRSRQAAAIALPPACA